MRAGRSLSTMTRLARNSASSTSCVTSSVGEALALPERDELGLHGDARQRVELAERLVEHEDFRIVDQRARQRDALRHAARELVRIGVAEAGQARRDRAPHRRAAAGSSGCPAPPGRARHCPRPMRHGNSVGSWNTTTRDGCGPRDADRRPRATLPARGGFQPGDQPQQRRLAAAGWARAARRTRRARSARLTSSSTGSTAPSISKAWLTCSMSSAAPAAGCAITFGSGMRYHLTTPFCQTSSRSRIRNSSVIGAGAQQRHHDQRRIHVGVGRPALRPLQVPAEPGLDADHLGHDQHGERRAQPHEQADEHVRQRGRNGDLQHQERRLGAERARHVVIGVADARHARPGEHRDGKAGRQRDQERAGAPARRER